MARASTERDGKNLVAALAGGVSLAIVADLFAYRYWSYKDNGYSGVTVIRIEAYWFFSFRKGEELVADELGDVKEDVGLVYEFLVDTEADEYGS